MTQFFYVYPTESTTFKYVQSGRQITAENIIADINVTVLANHRKVVRDDDPTFVIFGQEITSWVLNEVESKVLYTGWYISYGVDMINTSNQQIVNNFFDYQPLTKVFENLDTYKSYNANPLVENTKYRLKIYVRTDEDYVIVPESDVIITQTRMNTTNRIMVNGTWSGDSPITGPVDATAYYTISKQFQYPIPGDKVYILNQLNPEASRVTKISAISFIAEGGTAIDFVIKYGSILVNNNLTPTQSITVTNPAVPTSMLITPNQELQLTDSVWLEVVSTVGNIRLLSIDVHFISEPI